MMTNTAQYYNATTLAGILKVHPNTVRNWWRSGKLEGSYKSELTREIIIPKETAEALIEKQGIRVK